MKLHIHQIGVRDSNEKNFTFLLATNYQFFYNFFTIFYQFFILKLLLGNFQKKIFKSKRGRTS